MSEIPIKDAKNRAHDLLERLNASLDSGEISENDWYGELNGLLQGLIFRTITRNGEISWPAS